MILVTVKKTIWLYKTSNKTWKTNCPFSSGNCCYLWGGKH